MLILQLVFLFTSKPLKKTIMKAVIIFVLISTIIQFQSFSQSCLPDGINLSSQLEIDNFQIVYPNCTEIEGNVIINDDEPNDINNLDGLKCIISIGGYLVIKENNKLTNLVGLENLRSIGRNLEIEYNSTLSEISALSNLSTVGGKLQITNNKRLIGLNGLNNLSSVTGTIRINSCNELVSLTGLTNLQSIGNGLSIGGNPKLTNLNGLENITSIVGFLGIGNNASLTNIDGLKNITSIGSVLGISYNESLTDIDGLTGLETIGGSIYIWKNNSLNSIHGLHNVISIGGYLKIEENPSLLSLEGLDNIDATTIDELNIHTNNSLSICNVASICNYISLPTGDSTIINNAPGCNSVNEVRTACIVGTTTISEESFTIYPNPATDNITVMNRSNSQCNSISIINSIGQKVKSQNSCDKTIDISMLKNGLYIVEIQSKSITIRKKLIVK